MGETECEELMKEHSGTFMIRESAFDEGKYFNVAKIENWKL